MLTGGPAKKITIHINGDTSSQDDFLHNEVLAFLLRHGVAGATLLRPLAGFGSHHRLHGRDAEGFDSDHMPLRIEFVESAAKVESLLPALLELVTDGLIEAQDTLILKSVSREERTV